MTSDSDAACNSTLVHFLMVAQARGTHAHVLRSKGQSSPHGIVTLVMLYTKTLLALQLVTLRSGRGIAEALA